MIVGSHFNISWTEIVHNLDDTFEIDEDDLNDIVTESSNQIEATKVL